MFFGGDPGSPDTFQKFYADVEMYANTFNGTDPQAYLGNGLCNKAPSPKTQWQGENISRFCDEEYDKLHAELTKTAGIEKRAEIAKKLNDMMVQKGGLIPLVHRGRLSAHANSLGGVVSECLGQRALERRRLVPQEVTVDLDSRSARISVQAFLFDQNTGSGCRGSC